MIPKSCDCGGHFHVRSTKREEMMLVHRFGDYFSGLEVIFFGQLGRGKRQ